MIGMTLADIAAAVGGTLHGVPDKDLEVTGPVEYDSRAVRPGGLFVAFAGAKVDGHDFAPTALAAGAVAVLGTRPVDAPTIVVADPLAALGRLARAVVDRLPDLTIVGITGSSGKTTTKDQIGQVLARHGATVAPAGSFNNELGLPHTVLKADADTRYLVLEKGARGIGHIAYLCGIAPPRIGVVINVGDAHIGEFGSVEAIARAKGELVEALPAAAAGGVAVLNVDDARVRAMAARTSARVAFVGEDGTADPRAVDVRLDARGRASYTLVTAAGSAPVTLAVPGAHQVGNSLAAAAVGLAVGMDLADVAAALADLRAVSSRRMDVFDRADGVTVIDDSYNANPSSTAAALRALVTVGDGRRTIAALGYMAELGDHERAGHEGVGRLAAELGVDLLVAVGDAGPIHDGALTVAQWGGKSVHVTDQAQAVALLRDELKPGDVVLVKGSRYRTWDIADALREVTA
ncbi:UDP-N-acetylmuramoyl-tripeptide--D-alanyl-D-alanine ligase [Luedemannella flava]|uniref:UDP-N-acetylmuramoyl-tripeptide--D-alanyl-D-alanine ligase n=1 Tax=Luedemannella flava TaxID=349316 RepID=A0ABN2MVV1_9ACTN